MEVKPGYKMTEVGVIPEDWECVTVDTLVQNGVLEKPLDGNHGNIHPKSGDFVNFGIPFVMANNIRDGRIYLDQCVFLRKEQADSLQKGFSKTGDVLLTHKATIGNIAIVGDIPFEYIMLTPQVTYYRVADWNSLSNHYLKQYFESSFFQPVLKSLSGGGTRSYIGITAQLQLPVVMPPTKAEQEAIASALSDVDALIESLEQLIAKKRDIKQGAMQELLTGKRRLPGFSGEWVARKLEELAYIYSGGTPSTTQPQFWGGDVLWCTPTDITALCGCKYLADTNKKITEQGLSCSSAELIPEMSIVMTSRATIGECAINLNPLSTNQGFKNFVPFDNIDVEFLYYLLKVQKANFIRLCAGSTFLEIGKTQINSYVVRLPATKDEQSSIASALGDIDNELCLLENKLSKTRHLKQAMMQELLTGRIRLV